jgi:hypothetical protein
MPINWAISYARARRIRRQLKIRPSRPLTPIIYVPGILGVKLFDRRHGAYIWGDFRGVLLRDPAHAGYALPNRGLDALSPGQTPRGANGHGANGHRANGANGHGANGANGANGHGVAHHAGWTHGSHTDVIAAEPLHYFTIVPGLVDTLVTAEIRHVLEQALGYREGRDLFFLSYDWRLDYRALARRLEAKIRDIRAEFGARQQVIILGQSVANLAVRYLVRHGPADLRGCIAKWYAFGPTWKGTYNSLSMLRDGYYPATRRFHGFTPEDSASYPACHQLLPHEPVLRAADGHVIGDFDLDDVDCWVTYGLGPVGLADSRDARRALQRHIHRARAIQRDVSGEHPRDHEVPQVWLAGTRNRAVVAAVAHPDGALVTESAIRAHAPELADRTLARGDDHIPLSHLTERPCGPLVTSYDSAPYGESYVLIGEPKDHRAIINYPPNLHVLATDIATANARA